MGRFRGLGKSSGFLKFRGAEAETNRTDMRAGSFPPRCRATFQNGTVAQLDGAMTSGAPPVAASYSIDPSYPNYPKYHSHPSYPIDPRYPQYSSYPSYPSRPIRYPLTPVTPVTQLPQPVPSYPSYPCYPRSTWGSWGNWGYWGNWSKWGEGVLRTLVPSTLQ